MLCDKCDCFVRKVNVLFVCVLCNLKICFDPPLQFSRPDMTSRFLSHSSEDKGLHECTACICLVARLFFIRYTHRLLGCGTKRDLGLVMGWRSAADRWERGGSRRWGSKVKSWEVEKSREAIQNVKNTGKKKQENPHVLKNKQTPKNPAKRENNAVGGCGGRRAESEGRWTDRCHPRDGGLTGRIRFSRHLHEADVLHQINILTHSLVMHINTVIKPNTHTHTQTPHCALSHTNKTAIKKNYNKMAQTAQEVGMEVFPLSWFALRPGPGNSSPPLPPVTQQSY